MIPSSLLSLYLALSPTAAEAEAELGAAAQSIGELEPSEAITSIEAALAEIEAQPLLLFEAPELLDSLARARLALAWAYLAQGDQAAAEATIDRAIVAAHGRELPLSGLGPQIAELCEQRRALLIVRGTATIEVDCDACELLIDGVREPNPSGPLLLGKHQVWAIDPSGAVEPLGTPVELDEDGDHVMVELRKPKPIAAAAPEPEPAKHRLLVPRWAKLVGIGVGVATVVVGGVLLGLDGRCRDGSKPTATNIDSCREIWTAQAAGAALVAIGGGLTIGAGAWLTVDELRGARDRRAGLTMTLRF